MQLSLIGMSNVGKTFWSKRLAEVGWQHINCDDLIEAKLEPELKALGYSGLADMSRWMGQPYDERYSTNQSHYIEIETEVMEEIISVLKNSEQKNIVIDTAGSVIHTQAHICESLHTLTTTVYLEATPEMKEHMFQQYIANPKPVVFNGIYKPLPGESQQKGLERCYHNLLEYRSNLYSQYADVTFDGPNTYNWTIDQFLERITQAL